MLPVETALLFLVPFIDHDRRGFLLQLLECLFDVLCRRGEPIQSIPDERLRAGTVGKGLGLASTAGERIIRALEERILFQEIAHQRLGFVGEGKVAG